MNLDIVIVDLSALMHGNHLNVVSWLQEHVFN